MSTPTHIEPVGEEIILDYIYDLFPDDGKPYGIKMYDRREGLPRAECYVMLDGKCYRLYAERHPHPDDELGE